MAEQMWSHLDADTAKMVHNNKNSRDDDDIRKEKSNLQIKWSHLHGVERTGQAKERGKSNETEGHEAGAHLELDEVGDVVVDALAFLNGCPEGDSRLYI